MHTFSRRTALGVLRIHHNGDWSGLAALSLDSAESFNLPGHIAQAVVFAIEPNFDGEGPPERGSGMFGGSPLFDATRLECAKCHAEIGAGDIAVSRTRAPRDPDLVRLVAALAPVAPWGLNRDVNDPGVTDAIVARARALLAEIYKPEATNG